MAPHDQKQRKMGINLSANFAGLIILLTFQIEDLINMRAASQTKKRDYYVSPLSLAFIFDFRAF
jgi:hypothetical protein